MLPYQLAFGGLALPPATPLLLSLPVLVVFSPDFFSDFAEAVLSFLSDVFFAVSFFFAGVVSACDFVFSGRALGFGETFFLGLGLGEGFGEAFATALGDGIGWGVEAGISISLFAGAETG